MLKAVTIPIEVKQSSAQIQAEIKSWADWLVRAEAHPVGYLILTALGVFVMAEVLAAVTVDLLAGRRDTPAEIRRRRNRFGPLYNLLLGGMAIYASGQGSAREQIWMGIVVSALSILFHFAWVKRETIGRAVLAFFAFWIRFKTGFSSAFKAGGKK